MDEDQQELVTPLYATLFYTIRADLGITWVEYVYLDMVYHLSHDRWCNKSLENCGKDLGLDRSNVYRMRKKLIDKGLLIKNAKGYVKTSVTYAKRIQTNNSRMQNATQPYAKRIRTVVKTHTKNNNRITENNEAPVDNLESYKLRQAERYARLRMLETGGKSRGY
jgi:predicted transcriptional regulator